jgi:hypothetical protein
MTRWESLMEFFERLGKLITAAAAVVGIVFGLFNSILSDLVPPVEDHQTVLGVVSILSLVVLLAISVIMPRTPTPRLRVAIGLFALVAVVGMAATFIVHRNNIATYVYRYPPSEFSDVKQVRLIAGDMHELGRKRAEGLLLAYAVQRNGGPDIVNDHQLLWTQQSRLQAERKLLVGYEILVGAITTLLFALGVLALNRFRQKPTP